ncbi:MAG: 50S ribosomal protein L3 [Chromatiaceae bacterium]|jgi:large subunit ribosomal protein L3
MAIGIVGRKAGMTRVFTDEGVSIPVTVIEAEPNRVTQVRVPETDGYSAIQVTVGSKKSSRVNKPLAGHYAKAGVEAGRGLWEFRLDDHSGDVPAVGAEIDATIFEAGQKVDVRGISKGKGFQGGVRRHNFRTQDATHGNSLSHRAPGSIGQCQTPGRVFKGKKMAGHMGDARVTAQSIEVVRIDPSRNLILIKGAVPGARGGDVVITPAIKLKNKG